MKGRLRNWTTYVSTTAILLMLLHVATGRHFAWLYKVAVATMLIWLLLWLMQLWVEKKYKLMAGVFGAFVVGLLAVYLIKLT